MFSDLRCNQDFSYFFFTLADFIIFLTLLCMSWGFTSSEQRLKDENVYLVIKKKKNVAISSNSILENITGQSAGRIAVEAHIPPVVFSMPILCVLWRW